MSLISNESLLLIRYPEPTKSKGHYTKGTPSVISCSGNVQPLNGDELKLLSEGNRKKGSIKIYAEIAMYDDDIIKRNDDKYNVAQVDISTIDVVTDEIDYTCIINSTTFTHTSIVGATDLTIAAGLVAEINDGSEDIEATDNLDGTYTTTSAYRGTPYTIEVDDNQSVVNSVANITEEYRILQDKDYSVHDISHYKLYGFLLDQ